MRSVTRGNTAIDSQSSIVSDFIDVTRMKYAGSNALARAKQDH